MLFEWVTEVFPAFCDKEWFSFRSDRDGTMDFDTRYYRTELRECS